MQCPRCQFENMPGQTVCFRCGSALDGSSVKADIRPPRAAWWKKPFRGAHYWLRRRTVLARIEKAVADVRLEAAKGPADRPRGVFPTPFEQARNAARVALAGAPWMLLSTLPGLAHLVQRRFRGVFLWWASWLSALVYALFFFCPKTMPVVMLAAAVVLHAWIVADAGLVWKRVRDFAPRLVLLVLAAVWILAVYAVVRVAALRDISMGMSVVNIPSLKLEYGDYLLCRRLDAAAPLQAGDLVLIKYPGGRAVTQVIALRGERLSVGGAQFFVNGKPMDPKRMPVGDFDANLEGQPGGGAGIHRPLSSEEFLVRMRYSRGEVEGPLVVARSQILGRAFMRWMPLARRGFLPEADDAQ